VRELILPPDAPLKAVWRPGLLGGVMAIEGEALVEIDGQREPTPLLAVPNHVRLNRGGWSQVWITEDPEKTVEPPPPPHLVVKPIVREELDERTVDRVQIGDPESEKEHKLQGEHTGAGVFRNLRWRHAGSGWFSYQLAVDPKTPNRLLCTFWGSDHGNRRFDVVVDDHRLATVTLDNNKPGEFFDLEYPIPAESTRGKSTVTVRLQSAPGATAGGIFDLRTVRPSE